MGGCHPGWGGQAPPTQSLNGWAAETGRAGPPPAGLRPRPTTGRVPKTRARRKGGKGRLLAALLVVALLAVGLLTRAGGLLGGSVRVPEVVGLEVAEATQDLRSRGLDVKVDKPVASDHVHEGLVATQSVAGGAGPAQRHRGVAAVARDHPARPDPAAGRGRHRPAEGLDIRFRQQSRTSLTVAKGAVIATRPDPGTVLKADRVVTVVVSDGKPKVQVPDVAGSPARPPRDPGRRQPPGPGRARLRRPAKGQAVGTDPGAGSQAPWGSTVVLRVSKGPDLVEVPDVVGLSKEEADARLRAAGLKARIVLPVGSRVVQQSPGPGEKAKRGSEVRLLLNLF